LEQKELIASGRTAEVYAWQPGRVIKLFFDWVPQNWVDHEIRVGQKMSALTIPAPRLLEAVTVDNRRGLVYERVDGQSLLTHLRRAPWKVVSLSRLMARVQTRIHQSTVNGFDPIQKTLARQIEHADLLSMVQKERILRHLEQLPGGNTLLHYDMHLDQVLLTPNGPLVIDWVNVSQGHPMADVARSSLMLRVGSAPGANGVERIAINLIRRTAERAYLQEFFRLNPRFTQADLEPWFLPVAAARLSENIKEEVSDVLTWIEWMLKDLERG
jgi:aminoglycoside phosphotransferase (APT) family kinase protein